MLKIGDKVCPNPDYFVGTQSELIERFGTDVVTSEDYSSLLLPKRPRPHHHFINILWEDNPKEEC